MFLHYHNQHKWNHCFWPLLGFWGLQNFCFYWLLWSVSKNSLTGLEIGFPNYTMSLLYTIKEFGPKDMWSSMAQTYKIINEITWRLYEPPDLQNVSKCPTTGYFWIRFSVLEHNAVTTLRVVESNSPRLRITKSGWFFFKHGHTQYRPICVAADSWLMWKTCQHSPTPGLTPTGHWFCINQSPFYLVNFKF